MALALPWVNALLFALQLVLNANQNAFSPRTPVNTTPDIPIAPAGYAFSIWLVIYAFVAAHVFVDLFYPHFSIYTAAENPQRLRKSFTLSCVFNMSWIVLNNWLQWINVGTLDLALLTLSLLPIYAFLSRESLAGKTPDSWQRYVFSALAIRLYFSWICAATLLCFTASLQDFHGAYLSFGAYALLLAVLFVVALSGVVYADDPVIGLVITWALVGLINRNDRFSDAGTQHTFELIQGAATVAAPVLPAMILLSNLRKLSLRRNSGLLAKPIGSYQPGVSYGSVEP